MDVTPESNVRTMGLHLTPPNIQNKCFSERSHLMFCSMASHARTGFISFSQQEKRGAVFLIFGSIGRKRIRCPDSATLHWTESSAGTDRKLYIGWTDGKQVSSAWAVHSSGTFRIHPVLHVRKRKCKFLWTSISFFVTWIPGDEVEWSGHCDAAETCFSGYSIYKISPASVSGRGFSVKIFISDSDPIEEEASSKQPEYQSCISSGADKVCKCWNDIRTGQSTDNESD